MAHATNGLEHQVLYFELNECSFEALSIA